MKNGQQIQLLIDFKTSAAIKVVSELLCLLVFPTCLKRTRAVLTQEIFSDKEATVSTNYFSLHFLPFICSPVTEAGPGEKPRPTVSCPRDTLQFLLRYSKVFPDQSSGSAPVPLTSGMHLENLILIRWTMSSTEFFDAEKQRLYFEDTQMTELLTIALRLNQPTRSFQTSVSRISPDPNLKTTGDSWSIDGPVNPEFCLSTTLS